MTLPRSLLTRASDALAREWLVTNGLGGFACGTVSQANTRRYHGWLVASLRPPVDRVVMLAKADATVTVAGRRFQLGCNEFADGILAPQGFEHISGFCIEDGIPTWRYAVADTVLEQQIWMADGRNVTYVSFRLLAAREAIGLELNPLCTYRDYHSHTQGGWSMSIQSDRYECVVSAFPGAQPYRLHLQRGEFAAHPEWYWRFHHRAEAERGLDDNEDLLSPGTFRAVLEPGETIVFTAAADTAATDSVGTAIRNRPPEPVATAISSRPLGLSPIPGKSHQAMPGWIRRLTLAAEQFIVARGWGAADGSQGTPGRTVIAGYPWFSDWGRDTMIGLPGLTIATGRLDDAAAILRTFAQHTSQGMLPNRFPDAGEPPEYNTVDAALWYFQAVAAYLAASPERSLLREIYPILTDIIAWHERGTRYSIQVDPADGLLRAGQSGVQLTWMDARIGGWVVTPRTGKPVEINALWHAALINMAKWARELADADAANHYAAAAERVAASFSRSFWFAEGGFLYDVIDGPDLPTDAQGRRVDRSLRPNQLFAISLGTGLLESERAQSVVTACARELLTPVGLRSLAPGDPRYAGRYSGGPAERDAVYHQGTVWSWLLGPFALAHYNVYRNAAHALSLLEGLAAHIDDACLGSISEIFDGDPPHTPRGCFAQAWSVSETLRAWHFLSEQL